MFTLTIYTHNFPEDFIYGNLARKKNKRLHYFKDNSNIQIYLEFKHQFSSVAQSCDSLRPHGLQRAMPPCPSPLPEFTQTHVH